MKKLFLAILISMTLSYSASADGGSAYKYQLASDYIECLALNYKALNAVDKINIHDFTNQIELYIFLNESIAEAKENLEKAKLRLQPYALSENFIIRFTTLLAASSFNKQIQLQDQKQQLLIEIYNLNNGLGSHFSKEQLATLERRLFSEEIIEQEALMHVVGVITNILFHYDESEETTTLLDISSAQRKSLIEKIDFIVDKEDLELEDGIIEFGTPTALFKEFLEQPQWKTIA